LAPLLRGRPLRHSRPASRAALAGQLANRAREEVFRDGVRSKKIQQQNSDLKAMIDLLYGKWEALSREKDEVTA
jgi:hypothetical protein